MAGQCKCNQHEEQQKNAGGIAQRQAQTGQPRNTTRRHDGRQHRIVEHGGKLERDIGQRDQRTDHEQLHGGGIRR